MKKETISVPAGTTYYYTHTVDQIEDIQRNDIANGNTCDSAGESRVYSRITSSRLQEIAVCTILKTRNVEWDTWFKKPSHLIEVLSTINGAPRIILVRDPCGVQSQQSLR